MSDLVPVGELKPRDFFCRTDDVLRMKLADDEKGITWFARKSKDGFACGTIYASENVHPHHNCDSFDWTPPREPTALELAKEWYRTIGDTRFPSKLKAGVVYMRLEKLIAAMEREAAK